MKHLLPILCLAAGFSTLEASVLVNANFDAGYTAGSSLNGQSGSGDVGLSGTFTVQGSYTSLVTVVSATGSYNLSYNVAGGGSISSGANSVLFSTASTLTNDNVLRNLVYRGLSSSVSANDIYIRLLFKPVNFGASSADMFWLGTSSTSNKLSAPGVGMYNGAPGAQVLNGTGNTSFGSYTADTTYLLVAKLSKVGSEYESVSFWLDPAYGDSASPDATASDATASLTSLSFMGLGLNNAFAGNSFLFDSYVVGTTWGDVMPVPEPTTLAYGVLALGVLLGRRRRRA